MLSNLIKQPNKYLVQFIRGKSIYLFESSLEDKLVEHNDKNTSIDTNTFLSLCSTCLSNYEFACILLQPSSVFSKVYKSVLNDFCQLVTCHTSHK